MNSEATQQQQNKTCLQILLESCSKSQLLAIIAEMIEFEPVDYMNMSKEELTALIQKTLTTQ